MITSHSGSAEYQCHTLPSSLTAALFCGFIYKVFWLQLQHERNVIWGVQRKWENVVSQSGLENRNFANFYAHHIKLDSFILRNGKVVSLPQGPGLAHRFHQFVCLTYNIIHPTIHQFVINGHSNFSVTTASKKTNVSPDLGKIVHLLHFLFLTQSNTPKKETGKKFQVAAILSAELQHQDLNSQSNWLQTQFQNPRPQRQRVRKWKSSKTPEERKDWIRRRLQRVQISDIR